MTIHTDFRRGQKVRVILKDKSKPHIIGRFTQKRNGGIVLDGYRIELANVRAVTIERHADVTVGGGATVQDRREQK